MMPEMPEEFDDAALARYFAGESDEPEEIAIRRWVAGDPERAAMVARLRDIWEASAGEQPDVEAALRRVTSRRERKHALAARAVRAPWTRESRTWALAAAVVIAVGLGGLLRVGMRGQGETRMRELATPAGARTTVTLRDGTRLTLGPETHLRVIEGYGRGERAVSLDGEALFTVVHDARHPFLVRTALGVVRDVGTTFVVRAYAGDAVERVAVTEGEVTIGDSALTRRDVASIDGSGRMVVHRDADLTVDLAWVQGGLTFADTPLRQVVRELARTYGVDVRIADTALAPKPVTGSFREEPVTEVLDQIVFAVGAHYARLGRAIVIRRGPAPAGGA